MAPERSTAKGTAVPREVLQGVPRGNGKVVGQRYSNSILLQLATCSDCHDHAVYRAANIIACSLAQLWCSQRRETEARRARARRNEKQLTCGRIELLSLPST